jgi:Flp pilus assembly protein TadG
VRTRSGTDRSEKTHLSAGRPWLALLGGLRRTEGAALVEFAVSCLVLIPLIFGMIETCMALYTYNFVADAAREATRWASVRGSTSCGNTPGLTDCGFTTSAIVQTYVRGLGYPGANNLTATVKWLCASSTQPTTWSSCGGTQNKPGNQVQVVVRYNYTLGIPYLSSNTPISIASTSSMVISQ